MRIQTENHPVQRIRIWLLMVTAVLVTACQLPLAVSTQSAASLAGNWRLMAPTVEQMRTQLQNRLELSRREQQQKEQKRRRKSAPDEQAFPQAGTDAGAQGIPLDAPMTASVGAWQMKDQLQQQQALIDAVVPGVQLQVEQSGSTFVIRQAGVAVRRFVAGERSMRVTSYGELQIDSGWQGAVYVIRSTDRSQRLNILERFERSGDRLVVTVDLEMPQLKPEHLVASYALQPDTGVVSSP